MPESGVEIKIEDLKLHVKKATLEMKDGTNIMGQVNFILYNRSNNSSINYIFRSNIKIIIFF